MLAVDALRRREVVLLCGAGISLSPPSTLPDWKTLRDETVNAVAGEDAYLRPLAAKATARELLSVPGSRGLAPEVVASIISSVTGGYFQALTALRGTAPNGNHVAVARTARRGLIRHIISTNWDGLIEAALEQEGVPFQVFRTNEEFAACDPDADPPGVCVYKIHGCLTVPESITARIEDEARGLPEARAAVLRALLRRFLLVLWGYSGQDLKIDLDYLQMLECEPASPGFLWNLHADAGFRETPNRYILELAARYGDRAVIAHGALPGLLNDALEPAERVVPAPGSRYEMDALRTARTRELSASLALWAGSHLDEFSRLEAMAVLLQHAGELRDAAACCERLGALAQQQGPDGAFRVARASAHAMRIYSDIGDSATAEWFFRRVDDTARSHGDLLLVASAGLTLAELMRRAGQFHAALRAFGYGQILLGGASSPDPVLEMDYELGIGDTFADAGHADLALERYAAVEARARQEGRLQVAAAVLARRSWLNEVQDDSATALDLLRQADEIARSLGMRREHAVWSLRILNLEGNLAIAGGEGESPAVDDVVARNLLRERALAYATDAGDPLLVMQAGLEAAVRKGVPVSRDEVAAAEQRLDEIEAFARSSGLLRLLLEVASRRAWLRAGLLAHDRTLDAVRAALGLLSSVGDDGLAAGLLEMQAEALAGIGAPGQERLDTMVRLASIERRRQRLYPQLEQSLIDLRRELGVGAYPDTWPAFTASLAAHDPAIEPFLDAVARAQGAGDWEAWGRQLADQAHPRWRYLLALYSIGVVCRSARQAGQSALTVAPLRAVVEVAKSWSDHQVAAICLNERGLACMALKQPSEALACFEGAAGFALLGHDEGELLDDWFNAAGACEDLERYDDAVAYYGRVLQHPRVKRDPTVALETLLRLGEVATLRGRMDDALARFEAAEYIARAMRRSKRLLQIVQRLGKVHLEHDQFEVSIRYRVECAAMFEAAGDAAGAANLHWLVANTYLTKLGRARDALPSYERAIELCHKAGAALPERLQPDRDRCAALVEASAGDAPGLYDLLTRECGADERDRVLMRIAAGMAYNAWHFEPRSFAAYCEGAPHIQLPPPSGQGAPIVFPLRLPVCLETLAGAAHYERQKGDDGTAERLRQLRALIAERWSFPAGDARL